MTTNKTIVGVLALALIFCFQSWLVQQATAETETRDSLTSEIVTPWVQNFIPERQRYVSPNGQGNGEDKASHPMSFTKAINSAKAGDLIWMVEGTYTGAFDLSKKGKETEPIVFGLCLETT